MDGPGGTLMDGEDSRGRRAFAGDFLCDQHLRQLIKPSASICDRKPDSGDAAFGHFIEGLTGKPVATIDFSGYRLAHLTSEFSRSVPNHFLLGRKSIFHASILRLTIHLIQAQSCVLSFLSLTTVLAGWLQSG